MTDQPDRCVLVVDVRPCEGCGQGLISAPLCRACRTLGAAGLAVPTTTGEPEPYPAPPWIKVRR